MTELGTARSEDYPGDHPGKSGIRVWFMYMETVDPNNYNAETPTKINYAVIRDLDRKARGNLFRRLYGTLQKLTQISLFAWLSRKDR